ncbi:hypothetical protein [Gaoshiqia sediminis]|uniref:TetR/AcrR family transcriptional regulator n=1 Tax=Gaoshiqia sediminis TaxID=2986998 RepID=A0AA41Y2J4_9BACT|nr:hypothetical protein [Gaoshiqia sediminis]MCW0482286.1 hypothetical protein [Gaoshiqia sediminis]
MEKHDEEIIAKVGKIIIESGIESLSPERLARDLNIDQRTLPCHCETTEEILLTMLESLESELNQLVTTAKQKKFPPEKELNYLFKNLYSLFNIKPYYLTIIFSAELLNKSPEIQNLLQKIKISAKRYLLQIINHGKEEKVFKSKRTAKSLAVNILGGFRLFMNQEQLLNKMVSEAQAIKNKSPAD